MEPELDRLQRMDAILADPAQRTPERIEKRRAYAERLATAELLLTVHVTLVGPVYDVARVADEYRIPTEDAASALRRICMAGRAEHVTDGRFSRYQYKEPHHDRHRPIHRPAAQQRPQLTLF